MRCLFLFCPATPLWIRQMLRLSLLMLVGLSSAMASDNDEAATAARETREALDMARMELQRDLNNQALSDSEAADFRAYVLSLEQQLERQCNALPEHHRPAGVCELAPRNTVSVDTENEQTEGERSESLDQELEASLSAFDQMLLEEQESLSAKTGREDADDGGEGNGAGENGQAGRGQSKQSQQGRSRQGEASDDRENSAEQEGEQNDQAEGSRRGRESSGDSNRDSNRANTRNDPNRPARWEDVVSSPGKTGERSADRSREADDGQDDDVVARQIREAAEKETDPKLREKLWEEYRRYKRGL